jgi:hypothetical protein
MKSKEDFLRRCKKCNQSKPQKLFTEKKTMCLTCYEPILNKKNKKLHKEENKIIKNILKEENKIIKNTLKEEKINKQFLKIYKLIFEEKIIYIGSTKQKLLCRRKAIGYPKIPKEIWKKANIELIEETSNKRREDYWINYYKNKGYNLYNINKAVR